MTPEKPRGYSGLQIALHWTVAALVIFQLLVHEGMEHAYRAFWRGGAAVEPNDQTLANIHIYFGWAIFVLAVWRLYLRFTRGTPPPPQDEPRPLQWLASITHFLIYALILALPISGSVAWFLGVGPAAYAHVLGQTALTYLVLLHVAGALFQQFVRKSGVLTRMLMSERSLPRP